MGAGDCYGTGDSLWAATGGAIISSSNPKVGSNHLLSPTNEDYVILADGTDEACDGAKGRLGFWYYRGSNPSADLVMTRLRGTGGSGYEIYFSDSNGNDEVEVNWKYNASWEMFYTSVGVDLPNTTYVFLEFAYDATVGAGSDYVKVYKNGVEMDSEETETLTDIGKVTNVLVGAAGAHGETVTATDNIICSTDPTRDLYALALRTTCPN
jgi:hypothetical protein